MRSSRAFPGPGHVDAIATKGRAAVERSRPRDLAVASLDPQRQSALVQMPSPLFGWLSLSKIRSERIDGVNLRGAGLT
jgi:hypothetical protein